MLSYQKKKKSFCLLTSGLLLCSYINSSSCVHKYVCVQYCLYCHHPFFLLLSFFYFCLLKIQHIVVYCRIMYWVFVRVRGISFLFSSQSDPVVDGMLKSKNFFFFFCKDVSHIFCHIEVFIA